MATYTKETALYDTGAIATDIADAGTTASKYITKVDNAGISVHPYNDSSQSAVTADRATIDATGMTVYKNDVQRAKFGEETIIGKPYVAGGSNESHVEMDYHSLKMVDREGNNYVYFSDLRDANGEYEVTETYIYDRSTLTFSLSDYAEDINYAVYVNDVEITSGIQKTLNYFTLSVSTVTIGDAVKAVYTTVSPVAKAFTLGIRKANANVGMVSAALGYNVEASGGFAHAEGYTTVAAGQAAHAEGYVTEANGGSAHAEGIGSIANARASHAQNYHTRASSSYQTAIGRKNVEDTASRYSFIIGNGSLEGTPTDNTSNALAVDWSGNVRAKGDVYVGCNDNSTGGIQLMPFPESDSFSNSVTVNANSTNGINITYSGTYPIANYTCIAVTSCTLSGSGSGDVVIRGWNISNSEGRITVYLRNVSSSNRTVTVTVGGLFVKTS